VGKKQKLKRLQIKEAQKRAIPKVSNLISDSMLKIIDAHQQYLTGAFVSPELIREAVEKTRQPGIALMPDAAKSRDKVKAGK